MGSPCDVIRLLLVVSAAVDTEKSHSSKPAGQCGRQCQGYCLHDGKLTVKRITYRSAALPRFSFHRSSVPAVQDSGRFQVDLRNSSTVQYLRCSVNAFSICMASIKNPVSELWNLTRAASNKQYINVLR
jgi:hypothetical protein